MNYNKKDIIKISNSRYMIMSILYENGKKYMFTNEIDNNDEPINQFYVFMQDNNNNLSAVADKSLLEGLIPKFQEDLKKTMKNELESI